METPTIVYDLDTSGGLMEVRLLYGGRGSKIAIFFLCFHVFTTTITADVIIYTLLKCFG